MIKVLCIGDIVGKAGRSIVERRLPELHELYQPDFLICNGENSAGGFGMTEKIYRRFTDTLGFDCVTMGNHWADKKEIYQYRKSASKMVIPGNSWDVDSIHDGFKILSLKDKPGCRIAVVNLLGNAFMKEGNKPFIPIFDKILEHIPSSVKIRIVDFHAEATSEKQALMHYAAGKISLLYGTHTHVPCSDERIVNGHTGYISDLGMTGAYDSVIGIRKEAAIHRILTQEKKKFEPATQNPWLCAILAHIDPDDGRCSKIERIQFREDS